MFAVFIRTATRSPSAFAVDTLELAFTDSSYKEKMQRKIQSSDLERFFVQHVECRLSCKNKRPITKFVLERTDGSFEF